MVLSAVFSDDTFATSFTGTVLVAVLLAGFGSLLGLFAVAVTVSGVVALLSILPRIKNWSVPPLGMSGLVVVPVQGVHVLPPSVEYSTLVS